MKSLRWALIAAVAVSLASLASAQSVDAFFGFDTLMASHYYANEGIAPSYLGGGFYSGIGATFYFADGLGINGEVYWRDSVQDYGGYSVRPVFYDFNLAWSPAALSGNTVKPDFYVGVGDDNWRLYTGEYICSTFSCTDYVASNHLTLDLGADAKIYVRGHIFLAPEVHWYDIRHDFEYDVPDAWRVGIRLGYTLGGSGH